MSFLTNGIWNMSLPAPYDVRPPSADAVPISGMMANGFMPATTGKTKSGESGRIRVSTT